ncbi:MAG TPA: putative ABC transporter permease [Clostridiales bacterium]|nr:putative ABC transporter permease [Clostridiales bacterium]
MINLIILVLLFSIYSFIGWIMETIYVSFRHKKFVNRGFLHGPFCPIYGFGAILVLLGARYIDNITDKVPLSYIILIIYSIFITSAIEFVTGYLLEKIFHQKWWDYSNHPMNIKGYICPQISLYWGALAFVFIQFIHPRINKLILTIPDQFQIIVSVLLILYFATDTIKTVINLIDLRKIIVHYSNVSIQIYRNKILKYRRYFQAFPRLQALNSGIKNRDIKGILNDRIGKLKAEIKTKIDQRRDWK